MAYEPLVKGKKVAGTSYASESLTGRFDYFEVRTILDITLDGTVVNDEYTIESDPADVSQQRFDKLVETISLRAQPTIIGEVVTETETAPVSDIPATTEAPYSSGDSVTVYTVRFSVEHKDAWATADDLAAALNGVSPRDISTGAELDGFVWDSVDPSSNNVAVYKNEFLSKSNQ